MSKSKAVTGSPLGMTTGLTFSGSGELDNGSAVAVSIAHDDQNTYSTSSVTLTIPGFGALALDQGGGTGLDRLDDKMPTAWEESYDTGVGTGIQTVAGAGGSTDIEWAIDAGMLPDGMSAYLSWNPRADGSKANDKASGGSTASSAGAGYDLVVEYSGLMDGLNVFAGYSNIEQPIEDAQSDTEGDRSQTALGLTYAIGSVTVGYQQTRDNVQSSKPGGSTHYYSNAAYGISFAVNDDLSLSYGEHKSDRARTSGISTEAKSSSLQMAYSMGGATIKFAESSVDNASYSTAAANDKDARTIALTLAF
jgi:outer membrane protein OmpU